MSDEAIPAASLILVRDREGTAPEYLMVERAEGMAFAGGALVFPGGRIDPQDQTAGAAFEIEDGAARIAAIRETLEETAIAVGIEPRPDRGQALRLQQRLLEDAPLDALLREFEIALDLEALVPFARWLPRFHATRRFDTLFYVARAPAPDWEPNPVAGECAAAFWITAAEALERDARGEARLIFPTRRNLERLALHDGFDTLVADARAHAMEPITPWVDEIGGEKFITIPDGIGYPVTREKLDGLWRG